MLAYHPEERITPTDALLEPFMLGTTSGNTGEGDISGGIGNASSSIRADQGSRPQKIPKLENEPMETMAEESSTKRSTRYGAALNDKGLSMEATDASIRYRPSSAPSSLAPYGSKRRIQATASNNSTAGGEKEAPVVGGRQQNVQVRCSAYVCIVMLVLFTP